MTSFFSGLFRRLAADSRPASEQRSKRTGPLRVEKLEPRHKCAVVVSQDLNYIVIDGAPDADSLNIKHEPGESQQDDQIIVSWTSDGHQEQRAFDLYKYIDRGGQRLTVKNVEYIEFSGGRGKNKFWSQAKISSYLNDRPKNVAELHAAIYGERPPCWMDQGTIRHGAG